MAKKNPSLPTVAVLLLGSATTITEYYVSVAAFVAKAFRKFHTRNVVAEGVRGRDKKIENFLLANFSERETIGGDSRRADSNKELPIINSVLSENGNVIYNRDGELVALGYEEYIDIYIENVN